MKTHKNAPEPHGPLVYHHCYLLPQTDSTLPLIATYPHIYFILLLIFSAHVASSVQISLFSLGDSVKVSPSNQTAWNWKLELKALEGLAPLILCPVFCRHHERFSQDVPTEVANKPLAWCQPCTTAEPFPVIPDILAVNTQWEEVEMCS